MKTAMPCVVRFMAARAAIRVHGTVPGRKLGAWGCTMHASRLIRLSAALTRQFLPGPLAAANQYMTAAAGAARRA